jgi:U2 small nuclear ribonucleoprotein A'
MGVKSKTFDVSEPLGGGQKEYAVRLTEKERKAIEVRIRNAKSLDEVARLERELREGTVVTEDTMEQ